MDYEDFEEYSDSQPLYFDEDDEVYEYMSDEAIFDETEEAPKVEEELCQILEKDNNLECHTVASIFINNVTDFEFFVGLYRASNFYHDLLNKSEILSTLNKKFKQQITRPRWTFLELIKDYDSNNLTVRCFAYYSSDKCFEMAAEQRNFEIMELLLNRFDYISYKLFPTCLIVAKLNDVDMLRLILKYIKFDEIYITSESIREFYDAIFSHPDNFRILSLLKEHLGRLPNIVENYINIDDLILKADVVRLNLYLPADYRFKVNDLNYAHEHGYEELFYFMITNYSPRFQYEIIEYLLDKQLFDALNRILNQGIYSAQSFHGFDVNNLLKSGYYDIVKDLLKTNFDADISSILEKDLFGNIIFTGNYELVIAHIDPRCHFEYIHVKHAYDNGHFEILDYIMSKFDRISELIKYTFSCNCYRMLCKLIDRYPDKFTIESFSEVYLPIELHDDIAKITNKYFDKRPYQIFTNFSSKEVLESFDIEMYREFLSDRKFKLQDLLNAYNEKKYDICHFILDRIPRDKRYKIVNWGFQHDGWINSIINWLVKEHPGYLSLTDYRDVDLLFRWKKKDIQWTEMVIHRYLGVGIVEFAKSRNYTASELICFGNVQYLKMLLPDHSYTLSELKCSITLNENIRNYILEHTRPIVENQVMDVIRIGKIQYYEKLISDEFPIELEHLKDYYKTNSKDYDFKANLIYLSGKVKTDLDKVIIWLSSTRADFIPETLNNYPEKYTVDILNKIQISDIIVSRNLADTIRKVLDISIYDIFVVTKADLQREVIWCITRSSYLDLECLMLKFPDIIDETFFKTLKIDGIRNMLKRSELIEFADKHFGVSSEDLFKEETESYNGKSQIFRLKDAVHRNQVKDVRKILNESISFMNVEDISNEECSTIMYWILSKNNKAGDLVFEYVAKFYPSSYYWDNWITEATMSDNKIFLNRSLMNI